MNTHTKPRFANRSTPDYFAGVMKAVAKPKWCAKHPTSFWGVNQNTGRHYFKCAMGFKLNEDCEAGEE